MTTEAKSIRLVTPEGVPLAFPLASVFERLLAFLIDTSLLSVGTLLIVLLLAFTAGLGGMVGEVALSAVMVTVFLARHVYFVAFEANGGATLGKRMLGIRVVSREGVALQAAPAFGRNVMKDIEVLLPVVALLAPESIVGRSPAWMWVPAVLWVFVVSLLPVLTKETLRAGDMVAGTVVVRVPRAGLLSDEAAPVSGRTGLVFAPAQLAVYGEYELEALATLLRDHEGGRMGVGELRTVAQTIARKIGYPGSEPVHDPARFLRLFYRAQRAALEQRLLFGRRKSNKFDREK